MPDTRYHTMLMMGRDGIRQQNSNREMGAVNNEYSTSQPTHIITPMLVRPTHGKSISSSNISKPRSTLTDPRNNSAHKGQWFGSDKNRRISSESSINSNEPNDYSQSGSCEVDNHGDTMCTGAMFKLIEITGQFCDVTGFHPDLRSSKIFVKREAAISNTIENMGKSWNSVILVAAINIQEQRIQVSAE